MVRELLQPIDEGESGPTELENRDLVPSLEILGGILKLPRNRLLSLSFYCSESWVREGGKWSEEMTVTG
jgi:hypothetical protein